MSAEDFIDSSEGAVADVKWVTINLYYANKTGDALIKTKKKYVTTKMFLWKGSCGTDYQRTGGERILSVGTIKYQVVKYISYRQDMLCEF